MVTSGFNKLLTLWRNFIFITRYVCYKYRSTVRLSNTGLLLHCYATAFVCKPFNEVYHNFMLRLTSDRLRSYRFSVLWLYTGCPWNEDKWQEKQLPWLWHLRTIIPKSCNNWNVIYDFLFSSYHGNNVQYQYEIFDLTFSCNNIFVHFRDILYYKMFFWWREPAERLLLTKELSRSAQAQYKVGYLLI